MTLLKQLLDAGEKLLTEHASASALRDHLALVRAQSEVLEKENVELKRRVADLEDLSRRLTRELEAKARAEEFIEESGVLLKRNPRGGYHKVPYCPLCKSPLGSIQEEIPYACTQTCGFVSSLNHWDFADLLSSLEK